MVNLKIPIEGGATTSVVDIPVGQVLPQLPPGYHDPALSPDGRLVLGHYRDEAARGERIVIMPVDNPGQVTLFPNTFVSAQWAADGDSIIYIDNRQQMGNLWRHALTAAPPVQLTPTASRSSASPTAATAGGLPCRGARRSRTSCLSRRAKAPPERADLRDQSHNVLTQFPDGSLEQCPCLEHSVDVSRLTLS